MDHNDIPLEKGRYINRTELSNENASIGFSVWDRRVDITYHDEFYRIRNLLEDIVQSCDGEESCSLYYMNVENLDYGFNETSVYYYLELTNEGSTTYIYDVRFNFEGDYGYFECKEFQPTRKEFKYFLLLDNSYLSLQYYGEDNYHYQSLDFDTLDMSYLYYNSGNNLVSHFDSSTETLYTSREYGDGLIGAEVARFKDKEFVTSLYTINQENYNLTVNFDFFDDWNKIYVDVETSVLKFYDNDVELYDTYTTYAINKAKEYYLLSGRLNLTNSDYLTYQYPDSFTGISTFDELSTLLSGFLELEEQTDVLNISIEDITIQLTGMLETFEEEYDVGE